MYIEDPIVQYNAYFHDKCPYLAYNIPIERLVLWGFSYDLHQENLVHKLYEKSLIFGGIHND